MQNDAKPPENGNTPPPSKKQTLWIAIALGGGLLACCLCGGILTGISCVFNVGPLARNPVVGKWELHGGREAIFLDGFNGARATADFKGNGTGSFSLPPRGIPLERVEEDLDGKPLKDAAQRKKEHELAIAESKKSRQVNFKWHITKEEKPVLEISMEEHSFMRALKNQFYFKRDGDTLELTFVGGMFDGHGQGIPEPAFVFRRVP